MRFFKITREDATCIEQIYLKAFFGKVSIPPVRKTGIPGILLKLHRDFITRPTKVFYDEKKSRAYAIYFGLISSLKLYGIFKFFIPEISSLKTLLDFGCGTGASLVPLDLLGFRGTFFGADRSRSQIFQALQLRRFVSFPSQFTRRNVNGPFDAIIVSNVISEISANLRKSIVRNLAKKLSPEGRLILVEPGDYVKTQSLLRLKSVLVDDGLTTIFPCPGDYPCPLLGTEDWCHVCFEVERGEFLIELDRAVGLNHHRLKYSILVFSSRSRSTNTQLGRIIRIQKKNSHNTARVCANGRVLTMKVKKKSFPFDTIMINFEE